MNTIGNPSTDLQLLKSGSQKPINLNAKFQMDPREKFTLIISSKTFFVLATILTLGIYYLYYKFRLNDRRESTAELTFEEFKDEFREKKNLFLSYQSLKTFSDNINDLLKNRRRKDKELLRKFNMAKNNLLIVLGMIVSGFVAFLDRILTKITGTNIDFDPFYDIQNQRLEQHVERERKMLDQLSRLLNTSQPTIQTSFDFDSKIIRSLLVIKEKKMVSHYMKVVFLWIYVVLSILSLGIIPLMNRIKKKNWGFLTIATDEFNVGINCFNEGLGRLLRCESFGDYSQFLTREEHWGFSNNVASDLFRTKAFKDARLRRLVITLLSLLSFGFFPFFIYVASFLGDRGALRVLREEKIRKFRPENPNFSNKVYFFVSDVCWDLKIFINLCLYREFKIIEGFRNSARFKNNLMSWIFRFITNNLSVFISHTSLLFLSFWIFFIFIPYLHTFSIIFPMIFIYINARHMCLFFL